MEQTEYEIMHAQEATHWWFRGRRRILMDLLRRECRGTDRPSILDLGCGTGGNTDAYAAVGAVVGLEPNAVAVRMAQARGSARYCRGSATELPFDRASFDVVVASDVLEHIEDDVRAIGEIARVLRGGGCLIFTVPAHPWLFSAHDKALWHYRRYTRDAMRRALAAGGLHDEWLSYWNAILFPAVAAVRVAATSLGRDKASSDVGMTPALINAPLTGLLAAEAMLLRRFRLPWGVSLVGVARRA